MKIIYTADLHYPITPARTLEKFVFSIKNENPDAVIIGGDIGETLPDTNPLDFSYVRWVLDKFKKTLSCPILAVAGNHDLWTNNSRLASSQDLWNKFPQVLEDEGIICLERHPISYGEISDGVLYFGNVAIIGSYLHYDYSAAEKVGPTAGYSNDYYRVNKGMVNNDGNYLVGLPDDITFATKLADNLKCSLSVAQKSESVDHIIIATHVPCMEEQMTRNPHNLSWALGTPYFGNLQCQQDILNSSKVKYAVAGHSHRREGHVVEGVNGNQIKVITNGSDYGKPVFTVMEIE